MLEVQGWNRLWGKDGQTYWRHALETNLRQA